MTVLWRSMLMENSWVVFDVGWMQIVVQAVHIHPVECANIITDKVLNVYLRDGTGTAHHEHFLS